MALKLVSIFVANINKALINNSSIIHIIHITTTTIHITTTIHTTTIHIITDFDAVVDM